ncbi:MAG: S8 family serine peptidase [Oligoflexia bacterium]|nr:S8 family serine peptidase [Oligoflexia bacterium]
MSVFHRRLFLLMLLIIPLPLLQLNCSGKSSGHGDTSEEGTAETGPDPLFEQQWHLQNTGQNGGTSGEDINAVPAWDAGYRGSGLVAMIIDDGMEIAHADLRANISSNYTHNYKNNSNDPTSAESHHGTAVAGVIAARDLNSIGVRGVAPKATLGGNNLLLIQTSANTYDALTRHAHMVTVSNNSWGADDGYGDFTAPESIHQEALLVGVNNGRSGKGIIYVWSAGNGGDLRGQDNANYDGYTVSPYIMTICSVNKHGQSATYSEPGANLWVCSPSLGARSESSGIVTTDMSGGGQGYNTTSTTNDLSNKDYTKLFNGTSASAPIVAGAALLIVEANPTLTWRDVKAIIARTARKNDPSNSGWFINGAGHLYHHSYGFGVIDTKAAIDLAKSWSNLGAMVGGSSGVSFPSSGQQSVNTAIPDAPADASTGIVSSTITVSGSGISKLEFVLIEVTINHSNWGNLDISLVRSSGGYVTSSQLANPHSCYKRTGLLSTCSLSSLNYTWSFGSSHFFEEAADGNWVLKVKDRTSGTSGTVSGWKLTFFGS